MRHTRAGRPQQPRTELAGERDRPRLDGDPRRGSGHGGLRGADQESGPSRDHRPGAGCDHTGHPHDGGARHDANPHSSGDYQHPGTGPPTSTAKPPKIPLTAPTPKITATPKSTPTTTTPKATTPKKTTTTPTSTEPLPTTTAILLDTNAVTTYNPENYPAETFGDPSLAADGDSSTGWTARVDPAIAPRMAVGLLIDLNTAQKLSTLELITSTPGMTVEVFGANGSTAPATITDPAWTHLSPYQVEKKTHMVIKLGDSTKAFRFVTLWISGAPAASIGTATAPGRVSVNEVELFPTK